MSDEFFDAMNLTVSITFARVSASSCSTGSLRTEAKTGISCWVKPMTVWFWCWSSMISEMKCVGYGNYLQRPVMQSKIGLFSS